MEVTELVSKEDKPSIYFNCEHPKNVLSILVIPPVVTCLKSRFCKEEQLENIFSQLFTFVASKLVNFISSREEQLLNKFSICSN